MADLHLRLGRDVLTIADSARGYLASAGLNVERDAPMALFVEPEIFEEAIRLDVVGAAQCVILNVFNFTPAHLRAANSLEKATQLAQKSCAIAKNFKIQHPLLKVESCSLPLDETSKASLKEHCEQYKFVGNLFEDSIVDGFFITGFDSVFELKCAMTGLRMTSEKPIVYDTSCLAKDLPIEEDFAPASIVKEIIDVAKCPSIDEIISRAENIAASGQQFIYLKNAKPSQTSAIATLMSGVYL